MSSPEAVLRRGDVRVERVVTSGVFALDGGEWDVDNNVWLIGDDSEVVVVDAAHDAEAIAAAVAGRAVRAIVCTHGHNDHIDVAPELARMTEAPVLLHPGDGMLWRAAHPDLSGQGIPLDLADEDRISVAGLDLRVVHTPGHSPGSVCLWAPDLGVLFSGDTLFAGGPGATGRSYSDFPTIIESLRRKVLPLAAETSVLTGHGSTTEIGEESPHLDEWIARGW